MKKTILLLMALLLALSLFAGCDMRNGRVTNSPAADTALPASTPGRTPAVTDVPSPTATHFPTAAPGTAFPHEEPPVTAPPAANTTAARSF